jgi:hypothetical protein
MSDKYFFFIYRKGNRNNHRGKKMKLRFSKHNKNKKKISSNNKVTYDIQIKIMLPFVLENIIIVGKDNDGDNALVLLCESYQNENVTDIIRLLIDNQIEVQWKNKKGWNVLHCVYCFQPRNNLNSLVKLLIENKIDANLMTTGDEIGTARSFVLKRFKGEEIIMFFKFWIHCR